MIDDEETEAGDADNDDMSGEPDLSKFKTLTLPAGVDLGGEKLEHGLLLVVDNEKPASSTDRVLFKVRVRRDQHDQRDGYFRDYKDGTGLPVDDGLVTKAVAAHEAAVKNVRVTWRNKLEVAIARVLSERNEKKLVDQLTELAAVTTAWQEAIELRGSKARILAEQGAVRRVQRSNGSWKTIHLMPWWRRVLKALRILQ